MFSHDTACGSGDEGRQTNESRERCDKKSLKKCFSGEEDMRQKITCNSHRQIKWLFLSTLVLAGMLASAALVTAKDNPVAESRFTTLDGARIHYVN
jgi:hypothetical protein